MMTNDPLEALKQLVERGYELRDSLGMAKDLAAEHDYLSVDAHVIPNAWVLSCKCGWRQGFVLEELARNVRPPVEVLWSVLAEHFHGAAQGGDPVPDLAWMRDLGWFEPDPPMPDRALTELERLHVVWGVVDAALGFAKERLATAK